MRLISILNQCYHLPGFVYVGARLNKSSKSIEVEVRERSNSKGKCSICMKPPATYDHQTVRRFEFVPFWGFMVFLLYRMRRVSCPQCGVKIEAVPWGCGKHQMTTAYVLFLAHWAKKLSWKETAQSFCTSWDKVCQAVEVVAWGLEHRTLGPIQAIGVGSGCRWLRSGGCSSRKIYPRDIRRSDRRLHSGIQFRDRDRMAKTQMGTHRCTNCRLLDRSSLFDGVGA